MSKILPYRDRVIVNRIAAPAKSKGGIWIPETARNKPLEGDVVATGIGKVLPDGSLRELDVKRGDRVLFARWDGIEIRGSLFLREDDIIGVMAEDGLPRLLQNRILVRRDGIPEKVGHIFIPQTAVQRPNTGVVVSVGPGLRRRHLGYRYEMPGCIPGDRICFREHVGAFEIAFRDETYVIMRDEDVAGVIAT